jgi:hypothetical protein
MVNLRKTGSSRGHATRAGLKSDGIDGLIAALNRKADIRPGKVHEVPLDATCARN